MSMKIIMIYAVVVVLVCLAASLSAQTQWTFADIRKCVDIYAPIVSFTRNVKLTLTAFTLGDPVCVDYCCYVNLKKGGDYS